MSLSAPNPVRALTPSALYAVVVLGLLNMMALLCRIVPAVLVPEIQADLHINDAQISLMQGPAFVLVYMWMAVWMGGVADRRSRKLVIVGSAALWILSVFAMGIAPSFLALCLARITLGIGQSALSPATYSLLPALVSRDRLATVISFCVAASGAGMALALGLGGSVVDFFAQSRFHETWGLAPWRLVLLLSTVPAAVVALAVLFVREPSREASLAEDVTWRAFFSYILTHKGLYIPFLLAYGLYSMGSYGITLWTVTHARRAFDLSATEAGSMVGLISGIGNTVCVLAAGLVVDRLYRSGLRDAALRVTVGATIVGLPLGIVGYLSDDLRLFLLGSVVLSWIYMPAIAVGVAGLQMIAPPTMRGRFSAMLLLAMNGVGLGLGPVMVGLLSDRLPHGTGVGIALAVIIGIGGCAGAMMLWTVRGRYARHNEALERGG